MSGEEQEVGTLAAALAHGERLLEAEPELAVEQARAILEVAPDYPPARLLLGAALQRAGDPGAALAILQPLVAVQPRWVPAWHELGLALGRARRGDEAIAALRHTVALKPDHPDAWRVLADHLIASGDAAGADAAYAKHVVASTKDPRLQRAAAAMVRNEIPQAEALLKAHLREKPTDVPAIRMLAEVAVRVGRNEDAEKLLARCLQLAPGFVPARYNYAVLLHRLNKSEAALAEIERLLAISPESPSYRNLIAVILSRIGEYARSIDYYESLLAEYPNNAKVWLSYGHVLKTAGRSADCIAAYRRAIELDGSFGEAFWSLANMKTFRFTPAEMVAMRAQLARTDLEDEHRLHFDFALGKALEDAEDYADSFAHYASANAIQRGRVHYSADQNTARIQRIKADLDARFFAERAGAGCDSTAPIFIVGMPRAGSTLIEQILSSHSQVEGTTELPDITEIAKELHERAGSDEPAAYTRVLAAMDRAELRDLGELYLRRTRIHRKTAAPVFIDKMPNNFLHVGMIHLMLPGARIIDARRHPLGCCCSNFKQHYARGQNFSYGLSDMGRYYRDYVELMAHFDEVLPGRIHRVIYEEMVDDTENEVRRLLAYCGLAFESGCLRFFENERPVRTASSEQVRQPIYRDGVEQWRYFDEWLGPLREALGPVLDAYPGVPRF